MLRPDQRSWLDYNSAIVVGATGNRLGRYDKIHLVPFGEYIPFRICCSLPTNSPARSRVHARRRTQSLPLNGHRYGVFICYESVFADEVRQFARLAPRCW
jgi:apolipoprotein N-acyltransferase